MDVLGIDIGGSGIKGAPVDVERGALEADRHRIPTPRPATPSAVLAAVSDLVSHFSWEGSVGCGFPGVVDEGVVLFAPNLDPSWIGANAHVLLTAAVGLPVTVVNDADAAGLAEMRWGAGRGHDGLVLVLTFGSGIGSGLFFRGQLIPNTELGHVQVEGVEAEHFAAADVRKAEGLSLEEWADRVNVVLTRLEALLRPELFIIGGGVSRRFEDFGKRLNIRTPTRPARFRNEAGLIGAALAASDTTLL